jgi:hypothetical protein
MRSSGAAIEMTCGGVRPAVGAYPAHIDVTKVTAELPAFVKTMQKHGLRVKQIRGGNQTTADAPNLEAMVAAMGQAGATHYWCGTDNYDLTKPILPQLDAIKKKVEGFVKLNEKHGTTLMYHTRAGANSVGSVVWDLLYVMKDFDPKYVGFHWDTGHMSAHGANSCVGRRDVIAAVSWKDRTASRISGSSARADRFPDRIRRPQRRRPLVARGGGRGRGGAPDAAAAPGAPARWRAGRRAGRGGSGGSRWWRRGDAAAGGAGAAAVDAAAAARASCFRSPAPRSRAAAAGPP